VFNVNFSSISSIQTEKVQRQNVMLNLDILVDWLVFSSISSISWRVFKKSIIDRTNRITCWFD